MLKDSTENTLGASLRGLRQSRGLTQTELGRCLGVSLQQVQKYESGRDRLAASTLYRASLILNVSVSAFFAGLEALAPSPAGPDAREKSPVIVVPLSVGPRAAAAREKEIIDLVRRYQAIESAPLRASVRQIVRRLAADPAASAARSNGLRQPNGGGAHVR